MIVVLMVTTNISYGQKKENYLKEENLKECIKYIEEITFEAVGGEGDVGGYVIRNHNLTKVNREGNIEFNISRKDSESLIYEYNSKGDIMEVSFNSAGEYAWRVILDYDDKGNLIESNVDSENIGIKGKIISQYDDNGNMIIEDMYDSEGYLKERTKRTYDENKNIISLIKGNENRVNEIHTYSYDARGNKIYWTTVQDDEVIRNNTYAYDANNNLIKWDYLEYSISLKYIYTYDSKGNMIEVNSYYADGSLKEKLTYEYEYDKKDNWTKKITYNEFSTLTTIEERKIVYYGDKDENDYQVWDDLIKPDL